MKLLSSRFFILPVWSRQLRYWCTLQLPRRVVLTSTEWLVRILLLLLIFEQNALARPFTGKLLHKGSMGTLAESSNVNNLDGIGSTALSIANYLRFIRDSAKVWNRFELLSSTIYLQGFSSQIPNSPSIKGSPYLFTIIIHVVSCLHLKLAFFQLLIILIPQDASDFDISDTLYLYL